MKKIKFTLLLIIISISTTYSQLDLSKLKLTEQTTNASSKLINDTLFLSLDKVKSNILLTYPDTNSIIELTLVKKDNIKIINEFKKSNNEWHCIFEVDFSKYNSSDALTVLIKDTLDNQPEFNINASFFLKAINLSKIDRLKCTYGFAANPVAINGDNLAYLNLIKEKQWLLSSSANILYKYYRDDNHIINLQIKSIDKSETTYKDIKIKIYSSNQYISQANSPINYKELTISELQITSPQKPQIIFDDNINIFLNEQQGIIRKDLTIEGINNLQDNDSFNIIDIANDSVIVASVIILDDDIQGNDIYRYKIIPKLSNENSISRNLSARIKNQDFLIKNLHIFEEPNIDIKITLKGKEINERVLYYEKEQVITLYGINIDKLEIVIPFDFDTISSSNSHFSFKVKLGYDNKENQTENIIITYPDNFNKTDTFDIVKKIYYTTNPSQPPKNGFFTLNTIDKKGNSTEWDGINNTFLYQWKLKKIAFNFDNTKLGVLGNDLYYGQQDFTTTILHKGNSYSKNYIINSSNSDFVFELPNEFSKYKNSWDTIVIRTESNSMSYIDTIIKARRHNIYIRSINITSSPFTFDLKNKAWINTTFLKPLNIGIEFYQEDKKTRYKPFFISSVDFGVAFVYNTGGVELKEGFPKVDDIKPFDWGPVIDVNWNILDLNVFSNETDYKYDAFNMSFGFAYLVKNKSPLLTIGISLAFRDLYTIKK